jgi:hypothetical protein
MAGLVWDQIGDRFYETGVSKGVLYKSDSYGVAWSGIISIEEAVSNQVESVHFDGVKFNDIVTNGDFTAVLRAFTYPEEFLYYEGTLEDQTGFYVLNQGPAMFGLSYQTKVGDTTSGIDAGYKIHLLYNLTALPSQRVYQTLGLNLDPMEFEWRITGIPEEIENFRPTSHVVFDSRKLDPMLMQDLEDVLYGDEDSDARLPPLKGLATWVRNWDRFIITDHGDGTWSADSKLEGQITMLDETTFQIISDTATYLDADTYTIESSEKNEDDIWLP